MLHSSRPGRCECDHQGVGKQLELAAARILQTNVYELQTSQKRKDNAPSCSLVLSNSKT
jgi:hypothetical protein